MPVQNALTGSLANTWQSPRPGGRQHEGQDIFAPRGTAVYSATEGVVLRVGENRLGGNVVFVVGPGGRTYYYAHLDAHAPALEAGDVVATDTALGYVGTTGNARGTPPHLHFGVYGPAGAVDPQPLLVDR
jgi:murein DD-endopeptidase MepM/ murein hydrolase activator NlpD